MESEGMPKATVTMIVSVMTHDVIIRLFLVSGMTKTKPKGVDCPAPFKKTPVACMHARLSYCVCFPPRETM